MSNFDEAIKTVIRNEGSYTDGNSGNSKYDSGGETKFGISKKSYPELDISKLTLEQAKEIYKRDYWDNLGLESFNDTAYNIAIKLFDMSVNIGCKWSVKILQRAVRAITENEVILEDDGILGYKTLSAAKLCVGDYLDREEECALLSSMRSELAGYYRSLNNDKYINGWLNRAYS